MGVLQLKITLIDIEPKIWRRFLVKDSWTFDDFHRIIQAVMGWENYHLFEFSLGKVKIIPPEEIIMDSMDSEENELDPEKVKISDFVKKEKQKFYYVYDFGDSWEHEIIVEKIIDNADIERCPVCIDGERACPPEDCGGTGGYERITEFIKTGKDPWNDDDELEEWLGDWETEKFDINKINNNLKQTGLS